MESLAKSQSKEYVFQITQFGLISHIKTTIYENKSESYFGKQMSFSNEYKHCVCVTNKFIESQNNNPDKLWVFSIPDEDKLIPLTQESYSSYLDGSSSKRITSENIISALDNGKFHLFIRKNSLSKAILLDLDNKPIPRIFKLNFGVVKRYNENFKDYLKSNGCKSTFVKNECLFAMFEPTENQIYEIQENEFNESDIISRYFNLNNIAKFA